MLAHRFVSETFPSQLNMLNRNFGSEADEVCSHKHFAGNEGDWCYQKPYFASQIGDWEENYSFFLELSALALRLSEQRWHSKLTVSSFQYIHFTSLSGESFFFPKKRSSFFLSNSTIYIMQDKTISSRKSVDLAVISRLFREFVTQRREL